jgi:putative aldouronate transport system permease protein
VRGRAQAVLSVEVIVVLKKESLWDCMKKHWEVYLMLVLPLAYIVIFKYLPMAGIVMAFQRYSIRNGIFGSHWAGLKYFEQFLSTPLFWNLFRNTLVLSLYNLFAGFLAPILLALCLNEVANAHFKKIVQTVTYAPYFISTVVLVGILVQILHVHNGFINRFFLLVHKDPVNFMGLEEWFRHVFVWSGVWQSAGYSAIIYIAALSSVDPELIEASVIDGVNRFQKILHIDLPVIAPTIIILLILGIGGIMELGFEKVFLLQNPQNLNVSEVISTYVYKKGLRDAQYSYAAAVGLFNSVINLLLISLANLSARRLSNTSLW